MPLRRWWRIRPGKTEVPLSKGSAQQTQHQGTKIGHSRLLPRLGLQKSHARQPEQSLAGLMEEVAWGFIQAGCLAYLVFNYFLSSSVMIGPSMWPTFAPQGDVVLVEHLSHRFGLLQRGDIVTCICPENPGEVVCKRVVGLEGDEVAVPMRWPGSPPLDSVKGVPGGMAGLPSGTGSRSAGAGGAGGAAGGGGGGHAGGGPWWWRPWQDEKARLRRQLKAREHVVMEIPRGHIWLQGDNVDRSKDSRSYGPVPYALVTGKVVAQVWPLWRVRMMEEHGLPPQLSPYLVTATSKAR